MSSFNNTDRFSFSVATLETLSNKERAETNLVGYQSTVGTNSFEIEEAMQ